MGTGKTHSIVCVRIMNCLLVFLHDLCDTCSYVITFMTPAIKKFIVIQNCNLSHLKWQFSWQKCNDSTSCVLIIPNLHKVYANLFSTKYTLMAIISHKRKEIILSVVIRHSKHSKLDWQDGSLKKNTPPKSSVNTFDYFELSVM